MAMTDCGKLKYYEKGKLLAKIDKMDLSEILTLNDIIDDKELFGKLQVASLDELTISVNYDGRGQISISR